MWSPASVGPRPMIMPEIPDAMPGTVVMEVIDGRGGRDAAEDAVYFFSGLMDQQCSADLREADTNSKLWGPRP